MDRIGCDNGGGADPVVLRSASSRMMATAPNAAALVRWPKPGFLNNLGVCEASRTGAVNE